MAGRKRRSGHPHGIARSHKPRPARQPAHQEEEKDATIAHLTQELAAALARLKEIEERGTEAHTARKIESLLEAAQIARGQALDASLARSRAESELRALEKAILEARGPSGWLLRRAARRVRSQSSS
jgi:hypothetical protein